MDNKKEKKQWTWGVIVFVIIMVGVFSRELGTHKEVIKNTLQTTLSIITFPFIWLFKKIIDIGFWNIVVYGFIAWFIIGLMNKITHAYELLNGLSDDINDIKKKLGLETSIRTPKQDRKEFKENIKKDIYSGGSLAELEEYYGKKPIKKYMHWVKICMEGFQTAKYCPSCEKYFNYADYKVKCDTCKGDLVMAKDFWKRETESQCSIKTHSGHKCLDK